MPKTAKAIFPIPVSAAAFAASIEGLVKLNLHILEGRVPGRQKFPPLYKSGVVYKREPADVWRDIRTVYKSGWGDCEDLAAIRVAQLRFTGEDEQAHVAVYQSGARKYHAIVARSDGTTEDPSRRLGMLPGGRSPYGKLEGSDTMLDDNAMGHGDEFEGDDNDEFEGDHDVGRVSRRGWAARVARAKKKFATIDRSPVARAKRRKHARALARWCAAKHVREAIGDEGAWVGIGDDPLAADPNITFDLYKSGRGWSGIVRIPLDIVKAGRRQALIAKTSYTKPKRRRRRRKPKRRRTISRRRKKKRPSRRRRKGRAKRRTASKAIRLASRIASLPGVQAFIPPQAKVALKILKSPIAKFATKKVGKFLSSLF